MRAAKLTRCRDDDRVGLLEKTSVRISAQSSIPHRWSRPTAPPVTDSSVWTSLSDSYSTLALPLDHRRWISIPALRARRLVALLGFRRRLAVCLCPAENPTSASLPDWFVATQPRTLRRSRNRTLRATAANDNQGAMFSRQVKPLWKRALPCSGRAQNLGSVLISDTFRHRGQRQRSFPYPKYRGRDESASTEKAANPAGLRLGVEDDPCPVANHRIAVRHHPPSKPVHGHDADEGPNAHQAQKAWSSVGIAERLG